MYASSDMRDWKRERRAGRGLFAAKNLDIHLIYLERGEKINRFQGSYHEFYLQMSMHQSSHMRCRHGNLLMTGGRVLLDTLLNQEVLFLRHGQILTVLERQVQCFTFVMTDV